ncbi:MAG: FAD:protein FMN transferase [Clostridia bacterium]|nr:FAD:protein FMN transferase [Clostridia bacterium]
MAEKKHRINAPTLLVIIAVIALTAAVAFDAMKPRYSLREKSTVAMGTVVTQKLYSKGDCNDTVKIIEDIIRDTEDSISRRISSSDIAALNEKGEISADEKLRDIFDKCNKVYADSDGAFDITVGALSALWNIGEEGAAVPPDGELKTALSLVDGGKVSVTDDRIQIGEGQLVDLGAVGKGLVCDYIKEELEGSDVYGAVILVGGSVLLYGQNPDADSWRVAVRNPRGESNETLGSFTLKEGFVSTSGDYERILEENGRTYHHILDSKTGYPAESGLMSVTVVCDNGLLSDALSTAAFVLGREKGSELLAEYGAEGIFVDKDKSVYVTEGLGDSFTLTDSSYTLRGKS